MLLLLLLHHTSTETHTSSNPMDPLNAVCSNCHGGMCTVCPLSTFHRDATTSYFFSAEKKKTSMHQHQGIFFVSLCKVLLHQHHAKLSSAWPRVPGRRVHVPYTAFTATFRILSGGEHTPTPAHCQQSKNLHTTFTSSSINNTHMHTYAHSKAICTRSICCTGTCVRGRKREEQTIWGNQMWNQRKERKNGVGSVFFFGFVSPFNDCSSVKLQGSIGGPFIDVNEHALQGTLPLNSEGWISGHAHVN